MKSRRMQYLFRLIGAKYCYQDEEGVSPTEREYDKATRLHKTRFIFLSNHEPAEREPEVNAFIEKIEKEVKVVGLLSCLRCNKTSIIAWCVIWKKTDLSNWSLRCTLNPEATLEDIDTKKWLLCVSKSRRGFR